VLHIHCRPSSQGLFDSCVYHHMELEMVSVVYIDFCSVTTVVHSLNGKNVRVMDRLDEGGVEAVIASSDRLEW